ncbi:MAG: hypothetical protein KKA73_16445 [Chloroflexi bacterium]|nr:hypothetical protein [Chloroflexota bacterium]MBU1749276.1 hypothetical protein [Chloroflexota bacterium]
MHTRRITFALISLLVTFVLAAAQCPEPPKPTVPRPTSQGPEPTNIQPTKTPPQPTQVQPTRTPTPTTAPVVVLPQTPLLTVDDLIKLGLPGYTLPAGIQIGFHGKGGYYKAKFAKPGTKIYVAINVFDGPIQIGAPSNATLVPTATLGLNSLFYETTGADGNRSVSGAVQVKDNVILNVNASQVKVAAAPGGPALSGPGLAAPARGDVDDVSVDTVFKLAQAQLARLPDSLPMPQPVSFPTKLDQAAGSQYFESIAVGTSEDGHAIAPATAFNVQTPVYIGVDGATVPYNVGFYDPATKTYLLQDVGALPGEPLRESYYFNSPGQFEAHVIVGDVLAAVLPFEVK